MRTHIARFLPPSLLLGTFISQLACSSSDATQAQHDLAASLSAQQVSANQAMDPSIQSISQDPNNGTILNIKGKNLYQPRPEQLDLLNDGGAIAIAFVKKYRTLFRLSAPETELVVSDIQSDKLGYQHIRLQQIYQSISVWGSELIVHINQQHQVYFANGRYIPTPNIDINPQLDQQAALKHAAEHDDVFSGNCEFCTAQLVIFHSETSAPKLAYQISSSQGFRRSDTLFIDAQNGELLLRLPIKIKVRTSVRG